MMNKLTSLLTHPTHLKLWSMAIALLPLTTLPANAYSQKDLQTLLDTNECRRCNLTQADLSGLDLRGANLESTDLRGADLTGTNLTGAQLRFANLNAWPLNGENGQYEIWTQAELEELAEDIIKGKIAPEESPVSLELLTERNAWPKPDLDEAEEDETIPIETALEAAAAEALEVVDESEVSDRLGEFGINIPIAIEPPEPDTDIEIIIGPDGQRLTIPKPGERFSTRIIPKPWQPGIDSIPTLLTGANLSQTDLTLAEFHYAQMQQVDLRGAIAPRAAFRGANLSQAQLTQGNFSQGDFLFANLSEATIKRAQLTASDFSHADLSLALLTLADGDGANFTDARLERVTAREAILTGAIAYHTDFSFADLRSASLGQTKFLGATFAEADLRRAHLDSSNLTAASLVDANLQAAKLSLANLSRSSFAGANLKSAYLFGANLTAADFQGADLSDVVMNQADLSQATMVGANFEYSDLRTTRWRDTNCSYCNLREANVAGGQLERTNFTAANLTRTDFTNTTATEVDLTDAIQVGIIGFKLPHELAETESSPGAQFPRPKVNGLD
ncbi:MAG: hypothetical protein F6J87_09445 [Spirulina sp. SIO3F2]|nr:hypothetical protein [Spirulina sp. SIO3F2]